MRESRNTSEDFKLVLGGGCGPAIVLIGGLIILGQELMLQGLVGFLRPPAAVDLGILLRTRSCTCQVNWPWTC